MCFAPMFSSHLGCLVSTYHSQRCMLSESSLKRYQFMRMIQPSIAICNQALFIYGQIKLFLLHALCSWAEAFSLWKVSPSKPRSPLARIGALFCLLSNSQQNFPSTISQSVSQREQGSYLLGCCILPWLASM